MPNKARLTLLKTEMLLMLSLLTKERLKLLDKRRPNQQSLEELDVLEPLIRKLEEELFQM